MGERLPREQVRGLQAFVERHGYRSWLGATLETVEPGRLATSVPDDEKLANPEPEAAGTVHGGIAATLVDTASGVALRTTFDDPADAALTTTDPNVSYLRPATGDLLADAEVVRAGGSTGVARVAVESERPNGDRTEVAVGRATHRLFRDDES